MSKKKSKKPSTVELIKLIIQAVLAIAALITAIKSH